MRIMPSIMLSLVVFSVFPLQLSAQTFGGVGERAQGMAGAFVAVADDASAVYWNPAGLAWPTGSTFDAQLSVARDGVFFGAALPALGLSYYRLTTVSASGNRQNEGPGVVEVRTLTTSNVGATINQTIVNRLVIGSTIRLVRGAFDNQPGATTVDFDLGAMFSAGSFRAGVTARNLRQPEFQGDSGRFSVSRQARAGVAFVPRSLRTGVHGPFSLAFDADLTRSADRREAAVGTEYWMGKGVLGARAGVRWSTVNDPNPAVSGGLTVRLPHSLFVEGHLTNNRTDDAEWGAGARITF
jgi:hypothetical protein